jgi:hypothetical protein
MDININHGENLFISIISPNLKKNFWKNFQKIRVFIIKINLKKNIMKRIIISEQEKNRILGMHKSATSKHYLMEQVTGDTQTLKIQISEFPQVVQKFITDNGLDQNKFEWGDASKGAVNYKMSDGRYIGLGKISMFESEVNSYNQMKPNMDKCAQRSKRKDELLKSVDGKDPNFKKTVNDTLNKEFPNMGGCEAAQKIQGLINNK